MRATSTRLNWDRLIEDQLLIGRGDGARALRRLRSVTGSPSPGTMGHAAQMATTGDRFLVEDGVVQVVDDREPHPRTAVGVDHDTGEVLMLVVDRRSEVSRGLTMVELARMMIDLGAEEAPNLDAPRPGWPRTSSGDTGVVNARSDGQQRQVSNGVEVTCTPPA